MVDLPSNRPAAEGPSEAPADVIQGFERLKAEYNAHDPSSVAHNRPDLVEAEHRRIDEQRDAYLLKNGWTMPAPESAEERQERLFNANWSQINQPLSEGTAEIVDEQLEQEEALSPQERRQRVEQLRRELGDRYDQLVAEAKSALNEWRPEIESNRHVLEILAGVGRYQAAYLRARKAAGLK